MLFCVRLSVLCPRFRPLFCGPSVVPSCGLSSFLRNFFARNHSCFSGVVFVAVFRSLLSETDVWPKVRKSPLFVFRNSPLVFLTFSEDPNSRFQRILLNCARLRFLIVFRVYSFGSAFGSEWEFFGSSLLWTLSKDFVRCEFAPNFDPILFHKICARIPIPLFQIGISVFGHKKNSAFDRVLFILFCFASDYSFQESASFSLLCFLASSFFLRSCSLLHISFS